MTLAMSPPTVVVFVAALIAATTDLWKFKIYNALTIPLLLSGLLYHGLHDGPAGLGNSVLGMSFGFGSLLVFHLMGGVGAGDVKLMAAVGSWLGMPLIFYVFVASALAGGVYAVALLLFTGSLKELLINLQILWLHLAAFGRHLSPDTRIEAEVNRDDRRRRLIPFGAMVAVGVVMTYLWLSGGTGG